MFDVLGKLGWFFKQYWKQYTIAIVLINRCQCTGSDSTVFTWLHYRYY